MKYEDWKYLGTICTVLGGLLLLGGAIAYIFPKTYSFWGLQWAEYPYRDYAIPLFIFGVILLVIGIVTLDRAEKEKNV